MPHSALNRAVGQFELDDFDLFFSNHRDVRYGQLLCQCKLVHYLDRHQVVVVLHAV